MTISVDPVACLDRLQELIDAAPNDIRLQRARAWIENEIAATDDDVNASVAA